MIRLTVNGKEMDYPQPLSGAELLDALRIARATVVAEVNGRIVPRGEFIGLALQDGDNLELVAVVGGG